MAYFILSLTYSDGCTYSCNEQLPIEYESGEALICDIMEAAVSAVQNDVYEFEFLGRKFGTEEFVQVREITQGKNKGKKKLTLYNPDVIPLEQWLNQNALRQNSDEKQVPRRKYKLVELIFALEEGFTIEREIEDVFVPLSDTPSIKLKKGRFTQGIRLEVIDALRVFRLTGYRSAIDSPMYSVLQLFSNPEVWRIGEKLIRA